MGKPKTVVLVHPHGNPKKGFNDNDARYMCCRNKYHLRKGAIIVGGVELAAVGLTIIYCLIAYFMDGFYKTSSKDNDPGSRRQSLLILALAMSVIACVVWSIAVGLTIWGIKKLRPSLLIPHMMMQVLAIFSLGGLAALFIWWAVSVNHRGGKTDGNTKLVFGGWDQDFRADRNNVTVVTVLFSLLASASLAAFFIEIFFFFVVRRCYKYLRAKIAYQLQQKRKHAQTASKF